MTIVSKTPDDIKKTRIFEYLLAKGHLDGTAEKTSVFVQTATPLVDLIAAGPFQNFTLHNRDHAKKLLHLSEYVIAGETLNTLSTLELQIIVYAAFLHDMGMSLTSSERSRIISSQEFADSLRSWTTLYSNLEDARARLAYASSEPERLAIGTTIFQLQEAALCSFLRPRHATRERYESLIGELKKGSGRNDLFEVDSVSFADYLVDICISHNQDVGVLMESSGPYSDKFPRDLVLGGHRLNTQFCAAVLRLTDILDFDRERTPRVLFESLGIANLQLPGADISLFEWAKHMAVHTLEFNDSELRVSATSTHPVIQKSIQDFVRVIERELRDTSAVVKRNSPEIASRYVLSIPISARADIKSSGYVFSDMALRLNERSIVSLLMGDRLYSDHYAAVRELCQNALDACGARAKLENSSSYKAMIELTVGHDETNSWLIVKDNGIGMDEHVLSEYFLTLGNSYYSSAEFQREAAIQTTSGNFTPISRFGIGIASAFMIGDALTVKTKRLNSPRGDNECRRITIEQLGSLAYITQDKQDDAGTEVRVKLRAEHASQIAFFKDRLLVYLNNLILHPEFPITVKFSGKTEKLETPYVSLKAGARDYLEKRNMEIIELDLQRWSENLRGMAFLLFYKNDDGTLSFMESGKRVSFASDGVDPNILFTHHKGNVITVNGFRMSVKKLLRLITGGASSRLAIAFEIDVRGVSELTYDISRDRVIETGRRNLATWFWEAVLSGLKDTGVWNRLDRKTIDAIEIRALTASQPTIPNWKREVRDEALLQKVKDKLPTDKWPIGIHNVIALELGITPSLVSRAIQTLLRHGAVVNPNMPSDSLGRQQE